MADGNEEEGRAVRVCLKCTVQCITSASEGLSMTATKDVVKKMWYHGNGCPSRETGLAATTVCAVFLFL